LRHFFGKHENCQKNAVWENEKCRTTAVLAEKPRKNNPIWILGPFRTLEILQFLLYYVILNAIDKGPFSGPEKRTNA